MTVERDSVGVLDRMTQVLQAFDSEDRGIGLSELARRSGLPKSTVSRVVSVLVGHGYLERDGRVLHLGLRVFELGQLARSPREVRAAALPVLLELRERTGHSVHLAVSDGDGLICFAVLNGRARLPAGVRVGARLRPLAPVRGEVTIGAAAQLHADRTPAADPMAAVEDLRWAACSFGRPGADVSGEICISGHASDFEPERVAPHLRAAVRALTLRFDDGRPESR